MLLHDSEEGCSHFVLQGLFVHGGLKRHSALCPVCRIIMVYYQFAASPDKIVKFKRHEEMDNPCFAEQKVAPQLIE